MPMRKRFSQRGDTLVEVLLALAIIGLILGVTYGTASRSVRTGRFAQEQTEALKIAESQLELVKLIAGSSQSATVFADPDNSFCITGTPPAATNPCTTGLYTTNVSYDDTTSTFTVRVSWVREGALAADTPPEVKLLYRIFE